MNQEEWKLRAQLDGFQKIEALRFEGGWSLVGSSREARLPSERLRTRRGPVRVFQSLDTLARFCEELDIDFTVRCGRDLGV